MKLDKYPQGLLEALNLKQNGVMPSEFADGIMGVVEAFDFYGVDRIATGQSAVATVGGFNQTLVDIADTGPIMLRALGFTFVEGAAAGTFFHWALGVRIPSGAAVTSWFAFGSYGAIAAGATRNAGFSLPRPFVMPPGSATVGFFTSDAAGADHTFRLNRTVTSLAP